MIDINKKQKHSYIFVLYAINFIGFYQFDLLNSISAPLMQQINISTKLLSQIASYGLYINLITLVFSGPILDRHDPWVTLQNLILLNMVATLCFYFFPSSPTVLIYRLSTGCLLGFTVPGTIKTFAIYSKRHTGILVGTLGVVAMSAGIFSQAPTLFLINQFGLSGLFLCIILGITIVFFLLKTMKINRSKYFDNVKSKYSFISPLLIACSNGKNWILAIYASCINLPIFLLGDLWGNYFLQRHNLLSQMQAGLVVSMIFFGHLLSSLVVGYYFDLSKKRKITMFLGSVLSASILCSLIISNTSNLTLLMVLYFILGAGSGTQVIAYAYAPLLNANSAKASSLTIISACSLLVGAIAQQISGIILEIKWLSSNGLIGLVFLFSLISAIAAWAYIKNSPR